MDKKIIIGWSVIVVACALYYYFYKSPSLFIFMLILGAFEHIQHNRSKAHMDEVRGMLQELKTKERKYETQKLAYSRNLKSYLSDWLRTQGYNASDAQDALKNSIIDVTWPYVTINYKDGTKHELKFRGSTIERLS